jgi:hypothetical protein
MTVPLKSTQLASKGIVFPRGDTRARRPLEINQDKGGGGMKFDLGYKTLFLEVFLIIYTI